MCPRERHSVEVMTERYGTTAGVPPCPPLREDVPDCHPFQQHSSLTETRSQALISHFHSLLTDSCGLPWLLLQLINQFIAPSCPTEKTNYGFSVKVWP